MTKVELSVVIVSYNTKRILSECLESIVTHTKDVAYEIIIVDNFSNDGSQEMVRDYAKRYSQISLHENSANLGFGRANNLGAKAAKGDFLLFLNSDTLILDNALRESVEVLKKHPRAGAYSCRLLNSDGTFQASGGYFPTIFNLIAWQFFIDDLPLLGSLIPSFHPKQSQYDKNCKMDWVTGAYFMIKRDLFTSVGGFDDNIFMYTEEMELCFRLSLDGYSSFYTNEPSIVHLGGASGGSYLALTLEIKNMLYFWEKHRPSWQLPLVKMIFTIGSLLRLLIFGIIKRDEKAWRVYHDALGFTI